MDSGMRVVIALLGVLIGAALSGSSVDLSSVGSIARIVSFLGVGLAMLVVGYCSPLPPRLQPSLPPRPKVS